MRDLIISVVFLSALGLTLWCLSQARRRLAWDAEITRKTAHVLLGLSTLGFPWWFSGPGPVLLIAVLAMLALLLARRVPRLRHHFGDSLFGVERFSHGELYFTASVAILFTLAHHEPIRYVVPLLILTFADAIAALVGIRYGKAAYQSLGARKSIEGSLTMFFVAVLCTYVPVLLFTQTGRLDSLLIAATMGLFVMAVEGMCGGGVDNLLIPLGAFFVLGDYLSFTSAQLTWRLLILVVILIMVTAGQRWSTLDGGALLGATLYGYACYALGGVAFLIAPVAHFIAHLIATPRVRHLEDPKHDLHAVLTIALPGMVWLMLRHTGHLGKIDALQAFVVGSTFTMAVFSTHTYMMLHPYRSRRRGEMIGILRAVTVCLLPTCLFARLAPGFTLQAAGIVTLGTLAFGRLYLRLNPESMGRWLTQSLTTVSLAGLVFWTF